MEVGGLNICSPLNLEALGKEEVNLSCLGLSLTSLLYLGFPWTARKSSWSILKEINPECSLEGLMLKLKL